MSLFLNTACDKQTIIFIFKRVGNNIIIRQEDIEMHTKPDKLHKENVLLYFHNGSLI